MTVIESPSVHIAPALVEPAARRTVLPGVRSTPTPPHNLRRTGGWSRDELLAVTGAAASSLCTTMLLFGILAPLSGRLGFVVVTFVLFVAIYAFLVSLTENRPAVIDRVMSVFLASGAALAVLSLCTVVVTTVLEGRKVLPKANFYLEDMSTTGPLEPLTQGGISHAIVGTLLIMALCLILTVPLGLSCAVFLNETRSRAGRLVRTVVDAMTALPSIVAGLFIFATLILILGFQRSGLAASFAVSLVMLPIIIRASDVVLRLVPGNLREASAALGAPKWRTVWHVVLPTARSGLVTSVILGVARGVGETAPLLLTSGVTATMNTNVAKDPMMSLPLAAFEFVRSPLEVQEQRGFATAAVLMLLVLVLFTEARIVGGRPAGQVTRRQARRLAARSKKDEARVEQRAMAVQA